MSRHFDQADGLCEARDPATRGFVFNQTMLRIKSPTRSLDFYTRVLGMTLVKRLDFPSMKFTLYFLAVVEENEQGSWAADDDQRIAQTFGRPAMLELTHNWGDEDKEELQYHDGNSEPKGFGHIGFAVPDVDLACQRFEQLDVTFQKKPNEGTMTDMAFIKDPDGYWIEIFTPARQAGALAKLL